MLRTDDDEVQPVPNLNVIAMRIDEQKRKWKLRFDKHHQKPAVYKKNDLVVVEYVAPATGESR